MVVKWLIQNQFDKALEVMRLISCRRRYEIKRDTPHLDVEEEIRKNITSLLTDETEVIRLKEPEKKRLNTIHQEPGEESSDEVVNEEMIDTIVEQYLKEQEETSCQSVKSQEEFQLTEVSVKMLKLKERTETPKSTEKEPMTEVIKEEDYSYSYSYEEEIEKEISSTEEPQKEIPKESEKKTPTKKSEKSQGRKPKKDIDDEKDEELTKRIGFKYMYFRDIPKDLEDFNVKTRTWFGFDNARKPLDYAVKKC